MQVGNAVDATQAQDRDTQRRKTAVAVLSVASNSFLVVGKLIVGLMIGSVSVISEAAHSATDLVAALIALFAVRTSHKPADRDHPFGHGKVENISGAIEALLIFAAAAWIIYEALRKLRDPHEIESIGWGVAVMAVSAVVNIIVSGRLFRVARDTESVALEADGWHLRTDVYTSAGVAVGLAMILVGEKLWPHLYWHWLDPVAALVVAALIICAAWGLTVRSTRDLLDVSLPAADMEWLGQYLCRPRPSVHGIHDLRTRKASATRFIEFHLIVHSDLSVEKSHELTDMMTAEIRERFPGASVTIHVEPCDATCEPKCVAGCLLDDRTRQQLRSRQDEPGA